MSDNRSRHRNPGSSSLVPTESTQPGRAAVSQPGGATGSQPGGAAGPQPGGAADPQPGGAAGSQPGGAADPQPGGAADPQPGGAAGSQPGGAAVSQPGGDTGPQPGGATGPQPGGAADPQVTVPPKKPKMSDTRSRHSNPGSSSLVPTEGTQPGGAIGPQPDVATGPQPGGATGSQPGGATGPQPGGAAVSQPGGATGPQPGGAAVSQPGGATGPQPGGAAGSQPGGATGPQPGGATGPQPGGAAGSQPGGATGPQPGGATGPQPGGAAGSQPGGAAGSQPGGATDPQPGGATGPQPGGAAGSQPGGATDPQPGGATGSQPGGATGPQPGGATGSQPGGATGSQPGGATGPQPGGATGSKPGGATGPQPGGAAGPQPGGAADPQMGTPSQVRVKEEKDGDLMSEHLHRFTVKFSPTDRKKYAIDCDRPRTVLEVLKSTENYKKKMEKCADENIVIQLGNKDKKYIVATHFPCSCIEGGESVIILREPEIVEAAQDQQYTPIQSRDKYSVFYIDTVGGLNTKTKDLFRNNAVKKFKYLVVYGEKGMTVEEALKRDGRFIDDLGDFELSDNEDPNCLTECKQKVDNLHQKEFKICLPRNETASDERQQENSGASNNSHKWDKTPVLDVVKQKGISVKAALAKADSNNGTKEIYEKLRQQFPALKDWMENRFPDDSYQKALNLKKENFGKIQQSFSEVHRVRKLLKLGNSVCKVVVQNVRQGTGFVLFDNFILTNAHLFEGCVEGQKLKDGIDVFFFFNYEDLEPNTNYSYFQLAQSYIYLSEGELDYAVLKLKPEGQKSNQTTQTEKVKVPPGLLKVFGEMPENGEACLIGHPAGGLKKMDPICIIEKEKREQAVNDYLHPYKDSLFIVHLINHLLKEQHIDNILMGGSRAEKVATYHTFMYHGSSGSPVFDAHGRVFGLHTAGYTYGFPNHTESVIGFAQPLLTIFEHFVCKLKESRDEELLEKVEEEAKGNQCLEKVLRSSLVKPEPEHPVDHSDSNESMDTD